MDTPQETPTPSMTPRRQGTITRAQRTPRTSLSMVSLSQRLTDMEAYIEKQTLKKWIKKQTKAQLQKQQNLHQAMYNPTQQHMLDQEEDELEEKIQSEEEDDDEEEEEAEEEEKEQCHQTSKYPRASISKYKNMIMKKHTH